MGEPVYIHGAFGDRSKIMLQHGKKEFDGCEKCREKCLARTQNSQWQN